jgi:hypothetical protein
MIRRLEYKDNNNIQRSYAYELNSISGVTTLEPDIDLYYLEDLDFLSDPNNGYIDENGHPKINLRNTIKHIDSVNKSTWEFTKVDESRFDARPVRGGKTTGILTQYDKWGNRARLITGIGDGRDTEVIRIGQELDPEVMSKDLFIGNMSGYTAGFASGSSSDIEYSQILNPVNVENVNNYYPIINHGYFYEGGTEYYMFGNKQTEVLNPEFASIDDEGNRYFSLSGFPNVHSPVFMSDVNQDYKDTVATVEVGGYTTYNKNSFRAEYNSTETTNPANYEHDLVTSTPFVYIVTNDGEIVLPNVSLLTKNAISVDTPGHAVNGHVNVIRPNKNFRSFRINVESAGVTLSHGLGSTSLFVFGIINTELVLVDVSIEDPNTIYIPKLGISLDVVIFDTTDYSTAYEYTNFQSGVINHNLDLRSDNEELYVDPWVFGIIPSGPTSDDIVIVDSTTIDKDNLFVDFGEVLSEVSVNIIDFWRLNSADAVYEEVFELNTDFFSFQETVFWGNEGQASPFHRIYPPLESGVIDGVYVSEYDMRCQSDLYGPEPLDYISGYASGVSLPEKPIYITDDNQVFIPAHISGTPIITYEKEKSEAYEFKFRGTDVSPVTWYNSDRVIAIQFEDHPLDSIEVFSDINSITLAPYTTRDIIGSGESRELSYYPFNTVSGPPNTTTNVTLLARDDVGVALENIDVKLSSKRRLYNKNQDGDLVQLTNYDITILDNTDGLFSIPSGVIDSLLPNTTVYTNSLFDIIQFLENPGVMHVYDDDGYLFTTMNGVKDYQVGFVGSLYDPGEDELTHEIYKLTDVFGAANADVGFHNTPRNARVKSLRITAVPSGQSEFNSDIISSKLININPETIDDSFGYSDEDNNPNPFISTLPISSGIVYTVINGNVPTLSTARLYDETYFNSASGVVTRNGASGVVNVYDTGKIYIAEIDTNIETDLASGVPAYQAFISGAILRYDEIDDHTSIFGRGEYYG